MSSYLPPLHINPKFDNSDFNYQNMSLTQYAASKLYASLAGLSNYVTNSALTTTLGNYALLASPTFSGTPFAPTASVGTNTTQIATTAFVLANGAAPTLQTNTSTGTGIFSPKNATS